MDERVCRVFSHHMEGNENLPDSEEICALQGIGLAILFLLHIKIKTVQWQDIFM